MRYIWGHLEEQRPRAEAVTAPFVFRDIATKDKAKATCGDIHTEWQRKVKKPGAMMPRERINVIGRCLGGTREPMRWYSAEQAKKKGWRQVTDKSTGAGETQSILVLLHGCGYQTNSIEIVVPDRYLSDIYLRPLRQFVEDNWSYCIICYGSMYILVQTKIQPMPAVSSSKHCVKVRVKPRERRRNSRSRHPYISEDTACLYSEAAGCRK